MRKGTVKKIATVAVVTAMMLAQPASKGVKEMNLFGTSITYADEMPTQEESVKVTIDGQAVLFEGQQPILKDGRTLVPIRGVMEQLGWTVEWDGTANAALLMKGGITLFVPVDKDRFMIKEQGKADRLSEQLDVPAQLIEERTMLPLRAVAEAAGVKVDWISDSRTAIITTTASEITTTVTSTTTPGSPENGSVPGGLGEFIPELYDPDNGCDVKYFSKKYDVEFKDMDHIYAWQLQQFSEGQQEEAKRLYEWSNTFSMKQPGGYGTEWIRTNAQGETYSVTDKQKALIVAYKYRDYLTPTQQVTKVAPLPSEEGVYAAVHQLTTPVEKTVEVYVHFGSGNLYKVQRPVYKDGLAEITGWLSERQVSEKLNALQSKYPDGMAWGESNAKGCNSFVTAINDDIFGQIAYDGYWGSKHKDLSKLRVGDAVSFGTDGPLGAHIVVAWKVYRAAGVITFAEGNVSSTYTSKDGKVMWGRTMTFEELEKVGYTIYTFYTPVYQPGK